MVMSETRDNTSRNGKASSVQFLKFAFAPTEIGAFKTPRTAVDHPNYGTWQLWRSRCGRPWHRTSTEPRSAADER
jgi:hypothetical protein